MNITQSLYRWGNALGPRLPKKLTLEKLLTGVSPPLIGGELDWGADVGAERLRKELADGYAARAKEDAALNQEFDHMTADGM